MPAELLCPELEMGEVNVGGKVLLAHVVVDGRAGDALLAEIGTEGTVGAAVVEKVEGIAVVDSQGVALFPAGCPGLEPLLVGAVDFDALAVFGGWREREMGGWVEREGGFAEVVVADFEGDFLPLVAVVLEELAGEGVHEFVGD